MASTSEARSSWQTANLCIDKTLSGKLNKFFRLLVMRKHLFWKIKAIFFFFFAVLWGRFVMAL